MKRTRVISAFPGTGKSHYKHLKTKFREKVLDSDSSKFDKKYFPQNYIEHIKENIGKADIIFVSSHKEVREALVENNIDFTLVFPHGSLKREYLYRYEDRLSPQSFIDLIDNNWDGWILELYKQKNCKQIVLQKGQYISDVV